MAAPSSVLKLIENFENNLDAYRGGKYNETQVRRDFIDPFFEALGWDMDNSAGYAEAYRDVVYEDALKVETSTRSPDYSFRVGGTRKFFLEAKKPSVKLKDDPEPAFQLRRYGWSANLTLSILTDFEEFAFYDCRIKPDKSDKSSAARLFYCTFREYADNWDEISSIFSRESVLRGSFDRYANDAKRKRGTAEVDQAFLSEIEGWRSSLAQNLYSKNKDISGRELNYAVQQTIDRIVFLRICEDRGIEPYGRLRDIGAGKGTYAKLMQLFKNADDRYNSGLFHFKKERSRSQEPDALTPQLSIDDKPLKDIFNSLYYPDSPYQFSVIGAEILGSVYEQFLGKVIRLAGKGKAVVEDKPEVKKAGGVYYTPSYVVDYLIEHTIGDVLKDKSIKQASSIKLIDPACGSGSFLIVAYQYLLDWHLSQYVKDVSKYSKGAKLTIRQGANDTYKLTMSERKRILLDHIYGVDIDSQAVEVTKLSLLLKLLEGESNDSLNSQLQLFEQRVLPDLESNIKCGNSLIDTSISQGELLLDDALEYKINAFDWNAEYTEIMEAGGFHVVVGNPPYIFTRELISPQERRYYQEHYKSSEDKHNTYLLFMELLTRLLRQGGRGGYIVPNSWLTIESAASIRDIYVPRLVRIADMNFPAFKNAAMEPTVFVVGDTKSMPNISMSRSHSKSDFLAESVTLVERSRVLATKKILFSGSLDSDELADRITARSVDLNSVFDIKTGLQAYEQGKGKPPQSKQAVKNHIFDRSEFENSDSQRYLQGKDISRYEMIWSRMWMQYGPWLAQPRELGMFSRPRILIREITAAPPHCIYAAFSSETFLNNKSILNVLHPNDSVEALFALLGILNSRVASFLYQVRSVKGARKIFPKIVINNLKEFPYPSELQAAHQSKMATLTEQLQGLKAALRSARTPAERTQISRKINQADILIDKVAYEMYQLTPAEIEIVEGHLKS